MRARCLVLTGLLLAARPAHALTCTSGAFGACASVTIAAHTVVGRHGAARTVLDVATKMYSGIIFYISIGGPIFDDNAVTSGYPAQFRRLTAFPRGPVYQSPSCAPSYPLFLCDDTGPGIESWLVDENDPSQGMHHRFEFYPHLFGCGQQLTDFIDEAGYGVQMCDSTGYTGSVVYRFTLAGRWRANQVAIGWNNSDNDCIELNGQLAYHPSWPASAVCEATPSSITPEPSTWLLVGTGLAALTLVGRRRRSVA